MVKLNDVTLRDGHQSILGGMVQQHDLLQAAESAKDVPYNMYEVWGGTTFDAPLRVKGEDPFENLRQFRETLGDDKNLSMLLRGRNLVGFTIHDDSIMDAFLKEAAKPFGEDDERMGVNTFRIFDALNDIDNMRHAIETVRTMREEKGWDVHAQGTLCYTVIDDEVREANPQIGDTYSPAYYVKLAKQLVEAGADSICIKDMAGLLDAEHAAPLVKALKEAVDVPIVLHAQSGLGLSDEAILAAIEAGVDQVDVASEGLSDGSGHSATETILDSLNRRRPDLYPKEFYNRDAEVTTELYAEHWRAIRPKYAQYENPFSEDLQALVQKSQVPGGMTTTLLNQIKEAGLPNDITDKLLRASLLEMANVRAEACYITLVTPSSQIVGTQAVKNVLGAFLEIQRANPDFTAEDLLENIAEKRANKTLYASEFAVHPPFAILLHGGYGKLPYEPDAALKEQLAEMQHKAVNTSNTVEALPSLDVEKQKLSELASAYLDTHDALKEEDKVYIQGLRDNPSNQQLLCFAIKPAKPVNAEGKDKARFNSLLNLQSPTLAKAEGYIANPPSAYEDSMAKLSEEQCDEAERYAQAQLRWVRLKQGAIVLPEEEKLYQLKRATREMENAKHEFEGETKRAVQQRLKDFGIGAYGHLIDRARNNGNFANPADSWEKTLKESNPQRSAALG